MSEEDSATAEVVGTAFSTAVGLAVGGATGAIAGAALGRPLTDLVGAAWDEMRGRREANATEVVVIAGEYVGEPPERLLRTALDDEAQSRLLHAALQAAAATLDTTKVRALARALANGISDSARVDEELLVVRALADLDPVHVRTLARLRVYNEDGLPERVPISAIDSFLGDRSNAGPRGGVAAPVLAVLERHGMVMLDDDATNAGLGTGRARLRPMPQVHAQILNFGLTCLKHLEQPAT